MTKLNLKGFRKTATARAIYKGNQMIVNNKPISEYFQDARLLSIAIQPTSCMKNIGISIKVSGSGLSSQAQAVRHAIAKLAVIENEENKITLKQSGALIGDTRQVERKKPGRYKSRAKYPYRRR